MPFRNVGTTGHGIKDTGWAGKVCGPGDVQADPPDHDMACAPDKSAWLIPIGPQKGEKGKAVKRGKDHLLDYTQPQTHEGLGRR